MKKKIVMLMLAGAVSLSARTWTSADDSKQLEGEFQSFDAEKDEVAIEVDGKTVTFALDKLSKADQEFVKKQGEDSKEVDVAELFAKAKTHHLVDGKFEEMQFEGKPDYYLIYFSASW
ncbi:hypothetical protein [Roseibacillus persicicus]|uniref:hypothetical protein n=1 Tax=Roseibacillus persicicus TaxID=454148 RepID=UPI00280D5521|nr:hypothetical protein [Roseibacillus persicicus]MDQ8188658.1 hypothetical protein [Roseibacillus persicicus]